MLRHSTASTIKGPAGQLGKQVRMHRAEVGNVGAVWEECARGD